MEEETAATTSILRRRPHVALLCSPGVGHLIPRLHGFSVTLLANPLGSSAAIPPLLPVDGLPFRFVPLPDTPPDAGPPTQSSSPVPRIVRAVTCNLPHVRAALDSAGPPVDALVVDMFSVDALDVARERRVPCYMFFTSPCTCLALLRHVPALHEAVRGEFAGPVRPPGCAPVRPEDLLDSLRDRTGEAYAAILRVTRRFGEVEGFLVNSFEELEPGAFAALNGGEARGPPVYPVGPLVRTGRVEPGEECLIRWLDRQPPGSVVFVSFGSGGTLSREQTRELALGLEASGHRFLWAAKSPVEGRAHGAFFGGRNGPAAEYLPAGFAERTGGVGLAVARWAPQAAVLGQAAVGGFVTHCGWNSALESIASGVPMIAWPLYAEQRMNAAMLADEAGVALRPQRLMEGQQGEALRTRTRLLRDAAARAVAEGGSSFRALHDLANKWRLAAH
ncbi:hydroquinone glucosyltransferase-like [Ananas comosus]|uniref:Glycosyltransferase n=1 Tax=Ananas comosus TaxID=4615 RepID=A0A6P5EX40_ANACO|nr:hydroquinone glucosyltransferase-like [Ananas comosus]